MSSDFVLVIHSRCCLLLSALPISSTNSYFIATIHDLQHLHPYIFFLHYQYVLSTSSLQPPPPPHTQKNHCHPHSILFTFFYITVLSPFLSSHRPGCPSNVMRIATRNLETLSEIISLVNPSGATVGEKRSHSDLK